MARAGAQAEPPPPSERERRERAEGEEWATGGGGCCVIGGAGGSGTTLVVDVLGLHSDVAALYETDFITQIAALIQGRGFSTLRDDTWTSSQPPSTALWVAGTWENFEPVEMAWDGSAFVHELEVGKNCEESFQLLENGSWSTTLYPNVKDADLFCLHQRMCGPDSDNNGKDWIIGRHRLDPARAGDHYKIMVWPDARGRAKTVSWRNEGGQGPLVSLLQDIQCLIELGCKDIMGHDWDKDKGKHEKFFHGAVYYGKQRSEFVSLLRRHAGLFFYDVMTHGLSPLQALSIFCNTVFANHAKREGKRFVANKTPSYVDVLPLLAHALPCARVVTCVRDARDVLNSVMPRPFGPASVHEGVPWWEGRVQHGRAFSEARAERCMEIRFERFVTAPDRELPRLFGFLGLRDESKQLLQQRDSAWSYGRENKYFRFDTSRIRAGGNLKAQHLSYIEKHAQLLVTLGYKDSPEASAGAAGAEGLAAAGGGGTADSKEQGEAPPAGSSSPGGAAANGDDIKTAWRQVGSDLSQKTLLTTGPRLDAAAPPGSAGSPGEDGRSRPQAAADTAKKAAAPSCKAAAAPAAGRAAGGGAGRKLGQEGGAARRGEASAASGAASPKSSKASGDRSASHSATGPAVGDADTRVASPRTADAPKHTSKGSVGPDVAPQGGAAASAGALGPLEELVAACTDSACADVGANDAAADVACPSTPPHFICGSWSGWQLQEMVRRPCGLCFYLDVTTCDAGEFQIVRDCNWSKVFFPPKGSSPEGGRARLGPDTAARHCNWCLGGRVGEVWRVELELLREDPSMETASVSWSLLRREEQILCYIEEGPQWRRLAVNKNAPPRGNWNHLTGEWDPCPICMSTATDRLEQWLLLPQASGRVHLQSCDGNLLAAWDGSEQGFYLERPGSGRRTEWCDWTVDPVPEDGGKWFITSCHGTQLARLDAKQDPEKSVYMSPNALELERWAIRLVGSS